MSRQGPGNSHHDIGSLRATGHVSAIQGNPVASIPPAGKCRSQTSLRFTDAVKTRGLVTGRRLTGAVQDARLAPPRTRQEGELEATANRTARVQPHPWIWVAGGH